MWTDPRAYVPNFRVKAAEEGEEKEYKGTRKQDKPLHYWNILAFIANMTNCVISREGLEADDLMVIEQTRRLKKLDTIICSRDKDLRQAQGWHYSWEVGKQASIGPLLVEGVGFLEKTSKPGKPAKVWGVGPKFFYYQMLAGDNVDNITGIKGKGPVFAYKLLHSATTERECYERVASVYKEQFEDNWKEKMTTMASLLYLIQEYNEDGSFKGWRPPKKID